jgi:hypothetical protein
MLGILIPYHSFFEMCAFQLKNIRHFVKVPHTILIVDDSSLELSPLESLCEDFNALYWKIPHQQKQPFENNPSARHQHAVNTGMAILREMCSHILIFDNDMIFLNDFCPALDRTLWYVPHTRGTLVYPWLNLFLFSSEEKIFDINFDICPVTGEGTDSGGSLATYLLQRHEDCRIIQCEFSSQLYFLAWQKNYRQLCEQFHIQPWYEIFQLDTTHIFHFRGLSNWQNHTLEFLEAKKALILQALSEFQNTYVPDNH